MRTYIVALSAVIAFGSWISIAHAEDVLWSTTVQKHFWFRDEGGDHSSYPMFKVLSIPNISVAYHVRATNADTGAIITSEATVPQGTKVQFEFVPHVSADVYWFATGHSADSPNGDWIANAAQTGNRCASKDYFYGPYRLGSITFTTYVPFSVNPPTKRGTFRSISQ